MIRSSGSHGPSGLWTTGRIDQAALGERGGLRWLTGLLTVLGLLAAALVMWRPHDDLAHLSLAGTRGPACEEVVLAVDQSGSMISLAGARDGALTELLAWLPRNLRPDDELAVVDFAATATVRMAPVRVGQLRSTVPGAPSTIDGSHTLLEPVLSAVSGLPTTSCDVDVLLLSDGWLEDLSATADDGHSGLLAAGVHDLYLLVPSRANNDPPPEWARAYPQILPIRFDGTDAEESATAVADAIAASTGQVLSRCGDACS